MISSSKTVLIVGMHRSGTSLVANLLSQMGINFGENLVGASRSNPYGHFEDKFIVELNDELLKKSAGSWDAPPSKQSINKNWCFVESRLVSYINSLKPIDGILGIKDPRVSLILDQYLSIIDNCFVVYVERDINEVARSLNKRNKIGLKYIEKLSEYYNHQIATSLATSNMVYRVNYNELKTNKVRILKEMSNCIGLNISEKNVQRISRKIIKKEKIVTDSNTLRQTYYIKRAINKPNVVIQYLTEYLRRFYLRQTWRGYD